MSWCSIKKDSNVIDFKSDYSTDLFIDLKDGLICPKKKGCQLRQPFLQIILVFYNPETSAVPSKLTFSFGWTPAATLKFAPVPPSPTNSASPTL